ncbi:MAG: hypothetical protein M3295_10165 [Chloroflexota bacterium]|nr:hypothetical protein [Chloroflexota bacterium]
MAQTDALVMSSARDVSETADLAALKAAGADIEAIVERVSERVARRVVSERLSRS